MPIPVATISVSEIAWIAIATTTKIHAGVAMQRVAISVTKAISISANSVGGAYVQRIHEIY
jgi:hypothetical protein